MGFSYWFWSPSRKAFGWHTLEICFSSFYFRFYRSFYRKTVRLRRDIDFYTIWFIDTLDWFIKFVSVLFQFCNALCSGNIECLDNIFFSLHLSRLCKLYSPNCFILRELRNDAGSCKPRTHQQTKNVTDKLPLSRLKFDLFVQLSENDIRLITKMSQKNWLKLVVLIL